MNDTDTFRKKMIRLVLPIAFQQFMLALVGTSDAVMLGRLSQNSMAAVSLASQVTFVFNLFMAAFVIGENMFVAQHYGKKDNANISKNLVVCLCLGLGSAGSIIVGNELGAGRFEEAKKAGRALTKAAIVCGVLSGLLLLGLSPVIVKVVSMTSTAKEYLTGILVMCSYYLVGKSINSMTIGGIFPAGGDSKFGLLCDAVTLWCITVPIGCLSTFVLKLSVPAVYFVLNLDEIVKLPVVYRHYRKYGWVKNIT